MGQYDMKATAAVERDVATMGRRPVIAGAQPMVGGGVEVYVTYRGLKTDQADIVRMQPGEAVDLAIALLKAVRGAKR